MKEASNTAEAAQKAGDEASPPARAGRLELQPLESAHAEAFHRLINDWEICRLLPEAPFPYPLPLAREWIAAAAADREAGRAWQFAVIERGSGALIGSVGLRLSPKGDEASLGYWLGRRYWGRRYGREAAEQALRWGFGALAVNRITASVATDNAASLAVLRGIGFRETGTGSAVFICRPGARLPMVEFAITREALDFGAEAPEASRPLVLVAACALIDKKGAVLLARRPAGKKLAGLWEFPGGKLAPGETPEAALVRELREELGITVREADVAPFAFASHRYESFHLLMPLYLCRRWKGKPEPLEGQGLAWVPPAKLDEYPMPPADRPLIPLLRDFL
ncbi:MAG TPA: 8-oxo-dGTP diphosphatase MutT [Acetobacteraceae bacterium]|nr:8-oxo-dGTP diphosphatase MutT [Acetobacteraceae bacterium]